MQYSVSPRCELQELRPEAEREREHADAEPARGKKVPELVHEDEHAEHEQERQESGH